MLIGTKTNMDCTYNKISGCRDSYKVILLGKPSAQMVAPRKSLIFARYLFLLSPNLIIEFTIVFPLGDSGDDGA